MERLIGLTDQRVKKLRTLPATSRSIILSKTELLRESQGKFEFRNFRQAVEAKREKEVEWNQRVAEKLKEEAARKQEAALGQE